MNEEWDSTYRLRPYYRNIGIITTAFFLCAWVGSVFVAYFNIDGSFARPRLVIAIVTVVWGGFTLLGIWLVLIYVKYRLLLNDTTIRDVGLLSSSSISLDEVQELKWRLFPLGGSCVLTSIEGKVKIEFGSFTQAERIGLILYLRGRVSEDRQAYWDAFYDQFVAPETPQERRFANRALIVTLSGLAVVFGILSLVGRCDYRFLTISLASVLIGAWVERLHRRSRRAVQELHLLESANETDTGSEPSRAN